MDFVRTATRFELRDGTRLAVYMTYIPEGDAVAVTHVETDPAYGGRGLAAELTEGILGHLQESGEALLPFCPFVRRYLVKYPEYIGLVPAQRRAEFGLSPA